MKSLIMLLIATFVLFSCEKPKIEPKPAETVVCRFHKQYEKYFALNTHSNIAWLVGLYGQTIFNEQFVVETDTIWNIYANGSVEYLPCNQDTTTYVYFDAVGSNNERYVIKND